MQNTIIDGDRHFEIDPVTRLIKPIGEKTSIVQFDHDSERLTFSIPRYVEGHDMTKCTNIEVHYINTGTETQDENVGVYTITDMQIDPNNEERAICTWLISQNATQKVGLLKFSIRFTRVDKDANILYSWNTGVFSSIIVLASLYNSNDIAEQYADVLEQWKKKIETTIGAIAPYVGDNGNWFEWDNSAKVFVDTGVKAEGQPGEPGYTPQKGVDYFTEEDKREMYEVLDGDIAEALKPINEELETKANKGVVVASEDQLPTDASIGVIHEIGGTVTADYPIKWVTGKVGDIDPMFGDTQQAHKGVELGLAPLKPAPEEWVDYIEEEFLITGLYSRSTHIYNADDGSYVGCFSVSQGGVSPLSGDMRDIHGYSDNYNDTISFYICAHENANIVVNKDNAKTVYYNGTEWVELPTMERVGNIETALDGIIAIQNELIGGDSE